MLRFPAFSLIVQPGGRLEKSLLRPGLSLAKTNFSTSEIRIDKIVWHLNFGSTAEFQTFLYLLFQINKFTVHTNFINYYLLPTNEMQYLNICNAIRVQRIMIIGYIDISDTGTDTDIPLYQYTDIGMVSDYTYRYRFDISSGGISIGLLYFWLYQYQYQYLCDQSNLKCNVWTYRSLFSIYSLFVLHTVDLNSKKCKKIILLSASWEYFSFCSLSWIEIPTWKGALFVHEIIIWS